MDSLLFAAYNNCDLNQFAALIDEDIEFYHDKGGLSTSKDEIVEAIKNNICNKVQRELVPGSIEVYPIHDYGAIEMGQHRFHNLVEHSTSRPGKFVHTWHYKDGQWKLSRVISLH
ncbi:MAG: DUF4440 domain-containing protein [Terrimonas sp.]|nr:DUF4440 domain-containing protein [Terrimonas sp.]